MEKQKLNISCKNITLRVFIECDCNGSLYLLNPDASKEELEEIWNNIKNEYYKLSNKNSYLSWISQLKGLFTLESKLLCASIARLLPDDLRTDILQKIGYKGDKRKINALIKMDRLNYNIKRKEYDRQNTSNESIEMNEEYYNDWIIAVSKYIGFRVDANIVSIAEFLTMSNQMQKEYGRKQQRPN